MELKDWIIASMSAIALLISSSQLLLNRSKIRFDNRERVLDDLQEAAASFKVLLADLESRKAIFLEYLPAVETQEDRDTIVEFLKTIDELMDDCREQIQDGIELMKSKSDTEKLSIEHREIAIELKGYQKTIDNLIESYDGYLNSFEEIEEGE